MTQNNAWFCLRSHPKHEHIAGAQLRQWDDVEVFCPRIRFRRKTRMGAAWVTEALFPGYLFARFDPEAFLCRVRSAREVSGIVHFGEKYPLVPDATVQELRLSMGPEELATVTPSLEAGMEATIANGPFTGLQCVIHHMMPARERVAVLLNLLGQITLVELHEGDLVVCPAHPLSQAL
jgi:transcriptional antiterminator RfaH